MAFIAASRRRQLRRRDDNILANTILPFIDVERKNIAPMPFKVINAYIMIAKNQMPYRFGCRTPSASIEMSPALLSNAETSAPAFPAPESESKADESKQENASA